jgi:hypothetical protein
VHKEGASLSSSLFCVRHVFGGLWVGLGPAQCSWQWRGKEAEDQDAKILRMVITFI